MTDHDLSDPRDRFPHVDGSSALPHAASLRHTQARLEEADRIAARLRGLPRVEEADRPRLARNLGLMIEAAKADDVHKLIARLFVTTFGEDVAASAMKKRKRLIRLSGEALPAAENPGEYHARGAEFVRLAHAWADLQRPPHVSPEVARRRSVLNLIEGTTLDTQASATLRRGEAGRSEFLKQMGDVLARVEARVDLSAYFDDALEYPLVPNRTTRELYPGFLVQDRSLWETLSIQPLNPDLPSGPIGEDGDEISWRFGTHPLAPKVLIGFVSTPIRLDGAVSYQIPEDPRSSAHDDPLIADLIGMYGPEHTPAYEAAVQRYRDQCAPYEAEGNLPDYFALGRSMHDALQTRHGLRRILPDLTAPEHIRRIKEALVRWYDPDATRIIDEAEEVSFGLRRSEDSPTYDSWRMLWEALADDNEQVLWMTHSVFLAIYRERATERPRLVLTVSAWERDLTYDIITYSPPSGLPGANMVPCQIELEDRGSNVWFVEDLSKVNGTRSGFLFRNKGALMNENLPDFGDRMHFLPGSAALSFTFQPLGDRTAYGMKATFKPLFDDCPTSFSPAPHHTIAGAMLRNLAHAPSGKRLDELLLADALHKASVMRNLIHSAKEDYHKGVSRPRDSEGEPADAGEC